MKYLRYVSRVHSMKIFVLVVKKSKHAWISIKRLNKMNVYERCNLAARNCWNIETKPMNLLSIF